MRPSITASIVAFARGAASAYPMLERPLRDDVARSLLPAPVSWLIPQAGTKSAWISQGLLRVALAGLVDQIALRTAAIDEALETAIAAGIRQVVIIGAGLDARAYRIASLSDATVFEVDRQATQKYKQSRLSHRKPLAQKLVLVPLDLADIDLAASLAAAGHDDTRPTFWLCEGVTMYLPPATTLSTFRAVADRSCRGSVLAVTYMEPNAVPLPAPLLRIVDTVFAGFGEPLQGAFTPDAMASRLDDLGFVVRSDESSRMWAQRYRGNAALPALFRPERLVVAVVSPQACAR